MERKIDGMISLACSILVVIVFIKCSLAVTVNELEVYPEITLIADEVKQQLDKRCALPKQDDKCPLTGQNVTYLDDKSGECRTHIFNGCKDHGHESVLADPSECSNLNEGCTPCQVHRDSVNARISDGSLPHIGTFVPKCKESGHFKTKQFSGSTGYSFCYDKNGNKVESSDTPPGRGRKLDCSIYVDKDGNRAEVFSKLKRCKGSPVTPGLCGGRFKGFTFNYKTAKCEPFATVGCTLSKNGFNSELGCQIACEKEHRILPARCKLNIKRGNCFAAFPRFFFNKKTGKCVKFMYGGCGGNKNNFKTKNSCEKWCNIIY